jgi:hypothetical protein
MSGFSPLLTGDPVPLRAEQHEGSGSVNYDTAEALGKIASLRMPLVRMEKGKDASLSHTSCILKAMSLWIGKLLSACNRRWCIALAPLRLRFFGQVFPGGV